MQVAGLGKSPDDVAINGAVRSKAKWMRNNNATCNFWRCVENLSVTPTRDENVNVWAVSQGTALRRAHVKGNLILSDGGWSSGGVFFGSQIEGPGEIGSAREGGFRHGQGGGGGGGK